MRIKVLLAGCGDIALRLAARLDTERFQCYGLRRRADLLPQDIEAISWDLNRDSGLADQLPSGLEIVLITLVPAARDEAGYHQGYVKNLQSVITALQQSSSNPRLVLFASSTSVYGQDNGEWVDEDSRTQPPRFNGQQLLQAEALLAASPWPSCAVRFSGIYGPGRERLLRQVAAGELETQRNSWTNRIHSEDCAAVLDFLIESAFVGHDTATIPGTLIASDCLPCPHTDVTYWLAAQQGLPVPDRSQAVEGGKRCSNQRLLKMGFEFRYPSFREGYGALLNNKK